MRVSSFNLYNRVQSNVNGIQSNLSEQQFKLASGKLFNKASEDPLRAKQSEIIRQAMSRVDQYQKNISDAKGMLETTITNLTGGYGVLEKVNNEMIKASNEINNSEDVKTIAMVIDKSIEELVSIGNSKYLNRYIFSGDKILDKPFEFDGTTLTYNGSDRDIEMDISPYVKTTVINGGDEVLEKTIRDLISIRDQVAAGDRTGLEASMAVHKENMDKMMNHIAEIGTRVDSLNVTNEGYEEQKISLETMRSNTEDVDFAKAIIDYSITQRTYQASLQATQMMFKTSILDFM